MKGRYATPLIVVLFSWASAVGLPCAPQQQAPADDGVLVERDKDDGRLTVKIPAQDGKVAWEDVLRVAACRQAGGQSVTGQISLGIARFGEFL